LVHQRRDELDLAVDQFNTVINFAPAYPAAYASRGAIRAGRGELPEALTDFQRAIRLYEQQITELNDKISYAESHPQSRYAQADRVRAERDIGRVEALIRGAQEHVTIVESSLRATQ